MNSLRDICDYVVTRTNIIENYISTENMLPNKGGVCDTLKVPSGGIGTKYQVGDILISNIRPYFKKIWQADCEGACSTDVLCLRANENVDSRFLYYLLTQQSFFDYVMSGTKGCKMPRGDKQQIMQWHIHLPSLVEQKKIAGVLSTLDAKIQLNRRINDNLEQQAQTLNKSWFVDFEPFKDGEFIESELGQIPEGWQCIPFSMFVSESKAKTGKIGIKEYSVTNNGIFPRDAKYNKSLSQSSTKNKLILYGDLVFGMSRDILNWGVMQEEQGGVSSAYTVYNINSGIVNSTYLELFIKSRIHLFSDLIRPAAREGQGIDKSVLQTKVLLCPPQEVLDTFWPLYNSVTNQIQTTTTEINCLGDVRDTLLPKLMSGELKINEIDC